MTAQMFIFPLPNRAGKIRTVATMLMGMRSPAAAKAYRLRITGGLLHHLEKLGVPPMEQYEPIFAFWNAVHEEIARRMEGAA
ncbi:DUF6074 family protein [Rhizobium grahamii]|uniref:Uncharacterized protein n=1 Tax=Rhizobium grahamii TaxID=1120045 RepID=A0A370KRK9_9HYPH|nr:DUF6074 family protein [Rhizobium grahamii]RDJ12433.1 hypothetical protein B5K06_11915 [Rhizobium grahamii]